MAEQRGVERGGGADQDAVVVGDPLAELLARPVGAELDVEVLAQQGDARVADGL